MPSGQGENSSAGLQPLRRWLLLTHRRGRDFFLFPRIEKFHRIHLYPVFQGSSVHTASYELFRRGSGCREEEGVLQETSHPADPQSSCHPEDGQCCPAT